ncbi:MAG TPA: SsrA-binding protein SmpB [Verrucomicrobiales bacterium]|nr:SsrA-binding protein SmpB [Verrucomicrobiales bacterium]
MARKRSRPSAQGSVIATNRKALRDYHIIESYEAGVALKGTEVKSIRQGKINLRDAFCRAEQGEIVLHGCDIQPYENASHEQHAARRPRKLLLNRGEILRLDEALSQQGHAVVALEAYWKGRLVKLRIGVGRGKKFHDQREDLKKAAVAREVDREWARFNRGS